MPSSFSCLRHSSWALSRQYYTYFPSYAHQEKKNRRRPCWNKKVKQDKEICWSTSASFRWRFRSFLHSYIWHTALSRNFRRLEFSVSNFETRVSESRKVLNLPFYTSSLLLVFLTHGPSWWMLTKANNNQLQSNFHWLLSIFFFNFQIRIIPYTNSVNLHYSAYWPRVTSVQFA